MKRGSNLASRLPRRQAGGMAAYDRLPPDLRGWLRQAALPWSGASAFRLWRRAIAETGCEVAARARLDAAEARMLARDGPRVWGAGYPGSGQQRPLVPVRVR